MGIKRINEVISRHAPSGFFDMPITRLQGKRVAIDISYWLYANKSMALRAIVNATSDSDVIAGNIDYVAVMNHMKSALINFILKWLKFNITPIFVFDGKAPADKEATQNDRREKRAKAKETIDNINDKLTNNYNPALVSQLRKAISGFLEISNEETVTIKSFLSLLGIPILQAKGEAEQLCSMLCLEKKIAAVYTTDTDTLAYGCPLVIKGFSYGMDGGLLVKCVRIDLILSELRRDLTFFVDLCIMAGCDNNNYKNIPKYAALESYKLLCICGSIERLPNHLDITSLNHVRCRELFAPVDSNILIEGEIIFDIMKAKLNDCQRMLDDLGISYYRILSKTYNAFPMSEEGLIVDMLRVEKHLPVTKRVRLRIIPA